jgi:hypothetical protein
VGDGRRGGLVVGPGARRRAEPHRLAAGGALAVAVFGGLLADPGTFVRGVHTSLLIAAGVLALTTVPALFLPATKEHT